MMRRYRVLKHWHDETTEVGASNKRRTAHRICARARACNLSHVTWFEVVDRSGRRIEPSPTFGRRSQWSADAWYRRNTVAARGVW